MRVRSLALAALMAVAAPPALQAADMAGYVPGPLTCGGLQPVDTYVPPQVAYIVACTIPLPPTIAEAVPVKHGHWAKLWSHGHTETPENAVHGVTPIGPYGPNATHDAERYEGKLVYLRGYPEGLASTSVRPPVHLLIVPK